MCDLEDATLLALWLTMLLAPPQTPSDGVRLSWSAPAGCPDEVAVRRNVESLLGGALDRPGIDPADIDAAITGSGDRWQLALRVAADGGSRSRELPGTDCASLTEVAVVLIAVAIDPTLDVDDPPAPEPPPEPVAPPPDRPATPPPASPPLDRAPPPAAPATTRRVGGAIGLHAGVGFGPLPRVSGGLGLDGALRWRHARIELGVHAWLPVDTRTREPATGSIQLVHADVRGCGVPGVDARRWRIEFPLCGGLQLGAMTGRAAGVDRPRRGRLPWIAAEASAGVIALPTPRVGLRLDVRGAAPLVRPGFEIDGEVVHRARAMGVAGTLGLELRVP